MFRIVRREFLSLINMAIWSLSTIRIEPLESDLGSTSQAMTRPPNGRSSLNYSAIAKDELEEAEEVGAKTYITTGYLELPSHHLQFPSTNRISKNDIEAEENLTNPLEWLLSCVEFSLE